MKPSAVCTIDKKSIYSVQPGTGSLISKLQSIKSVSIFGHANLFSGATLVQDDVYVLFKDIDTRIVIEGENATVGYNSKQSSAIFNSQNVEMKKHEEIDGSIFTGRYTHLAQPSGTEKIIVTVTDTMKTDHTLARTAKITLQNGPSASATMNCVDSMGDRFTFSQDEQRTR